MHVQRLVLYLDYSQLSVPSVIYTPSSPCLLGSEEKVFLDFQVINKLDQFANIS